MERLDRRCLPLFVKYSSFFADPECLSIFGHIALNNVGDIAFEAATTFPIAVLTKLFIITRNRSTLLVKIRSLSPRLAIEPDMEMDFSSVRRPMSPPDCNAPPT